MAIAAAATILPAYLLDNGLIAPEGRTVHAPSLSRFLILAFELVAWGTWVRLLRGRSPLLSWFAIDSSDEPAGAVPAHAPDGAEPGTPAGPSGSRVHAGLVWISQPASGRRADAGRHRGGYRPGRRGYSFSARRLALAGSQTAVVIARASRSIAPSCGSSTIMWGGGRGRDAGPGRWP